MKEKILAALRDAEGYVSGQELCEQFGVSRTAVWKAINSLKEAGYEIDSVTNKGYCLKSAPDVIDAKELLSLRQTKWVGQEIYYFDETNSTNVQAREYAEKGAANGAVFVAEKQTAGRGRRGRSWETPEGTNIAMSILLKPEIVPNHASMLTLVAALSVAQAIENCSQTKVQIKWPNDIVINGKKVVGILTEMSAQMDYINHIVIGIGINVLTEEFPENVPEWASSILLETGKRIRRAELIEEILEEFEYYYELFLETEDLSGLIKDYNAMLVNMNKDVKVLDPKEPFTGKAQGITKTGELIVDTWESRRLVSSGEVSVRGLYGYVD